jgi:predicted branched-subunit amino acid permease
MDRSELRAGARASAPMLAAVIPFGLVAGAAPAAAGFGVAAAIGMSTIIFAGASQLALTDVLAGGGSALVAAMAAWTINLRILLYSASLAPYLAHEPLGRRLAAAYVTVDQNYALAISHWANGTRRPDAGFMIGGGVLLGAAWVLCTAIGAVVGRSLPEELPLDFTVPLVFLVLLVPVLVTRPAWAAAGGGGTAAVMSGQMGAGPWAVMIGALTGIALGALVDWRTEGRGVEPSGG